MIKRICRILVLLAPVFLLLQSGGAAQSLEFFRPLRTDEPPVIDGALDDPVWRKAPSVSGFMTKSSSVSAPKALARSRGPF